MRHLICPKCGSVRKVNDFLLCRLPLHLPRKGSMILTEDAAAACASSWQLCPTKPKKGKSKK